MENPSSNYSLEAERQTKSVPTECKICGDLAIYSYFGVITCSACKVFFRRNAKQGLEVLKCRFHGHCKININNRRLCTYCRLIKCFTSGMQVNMIRSSRLKPNKTRRKRETMTQLEETRSLVLVRSNEFEQFPVTSLLRPNQSTLTTDQWNLLSNLSNCYNEHSGLAIGERYMREENGLPLKRRFKSTTMLNLYRTLLDGVQLLYKNNQDFLSLSANDRSILLHNTMKHTATASTSFIVYQIRLMNCSAYYNAVEILSNPSLVVDIKRMVDRLDFDVIIMKLLVAILSFSTVRFTVYSNTPPVNLSNIKQILRIQDTYIELTWQYLLYTYNYERAVKYFSNLIRCIFAIHNVIFKIKDLQWFSNPVDSLAQQTEQTLTLID